MKKRLIALIGLLFLFIAAGCGEDSTSNEPQDMKEMVQRYSVGEVEDVTSASITATELIVTDKANNETAYNLPADEFFVSIAPYVETTHPCTNHNLTSCQGELPEEEFDIKIEDEQGNVVVDETVTSLENGFIDLWLPRNKTYQVTIQHNGKVVESEISTFEDSNTCITTMQLV